MPLYVVHHEANRFSLKLNFISILACDDWLGVQLWSAFAETPKSEGMVQICESNGQWKGMCTRGSWCTDAKVACRDLGFSGSNR